MDRNLLLVVILAIFLSYMLITSGRGPEKKIEINPLGRVSILLQSLLFYGVSMSKINKLFLCNELLRFQLRFMRLLLSAQIRLHRLEKESIV